MPKTDLEIAQETTLEPIAKVAQKIGIDADQLEPYGKYKAKLSFDYLKSLESNQDGKLILVTAINPTKAGEGKSTTTVGLGDALNVLGKKTMMALREPSLGPVFGLKGGATGGGYAQVVPMEDINLHFTGDMHAITTANNLVSACFVHPFLMKIFIFQCFQILRCWSILRIMMLLNNYLDVLYS